MIRRSTVLVLGAGASMDYKYPSAHGLVDDVRKVLRDPNRLPLIDKCGIDRRQAEEFANELRRADPPSVDFFLEHRQDFLSVGKLAIALALAPYEDERNLFPDRDRTTHWYQVLANALACSRSALFGNKLAIITFNYDRSLEHYLFNSFKSRYGLSADEAAEFVKSLSIIHVHGSLGPLPWQDAARGRPYGSPLTDETLPTAAASLQIVHEDISRDVLAAVASHIEFAKSIVFVGFGYHEANLRRLHIPTQLAGSAIGSACGMTALERERVTSKWPIKLDNGGHRALEYLRESVQLDWGN